MYYYYYCTDPDPSLSNRGTLSTGAKNIEMPVRMNTIRPVTLCSLWGKGGISWDLG
jgi:hypothetical protein